MTPEKERQRITAVHRYGILDTPREVTFDLITSTLTELLGVPYACVSLVDQERVWFKSAVGLDEREMKREEGLCSTLVANDEDVRHLEDASVHPSTRNNSLVRAVPGIRFYAGAPLCTPDGHRIGTLCSFGPKPRGLSTGERTALRNLATLVMHEIELRTTQKDLERTEAALGTSQRLEGIGMVASGVAHDFNNLLGGMLGYAELLRRQLVGNPAGMGLLEEIITTGQRAADLVSQVLAYAGHDEDSPPTSMDLNDLVRETHRMLRTSIETKVQVHLDLEEGLPAVWGQSTGLRQLILNLLKNASEACRDNAGNVWLATAMQQGGQNVELVVSDDGCGMTPEVRARIFEPFYSSKAGGRGLGLAICHRVLERHGASIEVESEVGHGTTFRITLPASADSPSKETLIADDCGNLVGQGVVLLVDDEVVLRNLARLALEAAGYDVIVADGGPEALEILDKPDVDINVMILDWHMPLMNGDKVLEAMHKRRLRVPVILSSGHGEKMVRENATAYPYAVQVFLKKPYRLDELVACVKAAQGLES